VTVASGVFLACVRDVLGAALLAGVALAALLSGVARPVESPRPGTVGPPRSAVPTDGPATHGLLPALADDRRQVFGLVLPAGWAYLWDGSRRRSPTSPLGLRSQAAILAPISSSEAAGVSRLMRCPYI
jgi:hypothetical protein